MNLTMEEMQAVEDSFLEHSGVKNMKWGQRRYQNPDGSLTALGRIHYGIGQRRAAKAAAKKTKVMQSGDIKTVLKYRKKLTDEEFDTAMNRIAKTEALRSKERAEKEAKQRAKDEARAAKDKTKLRKEELDNAKDIAKIEAKTKVKQAKSGNLIKKGLAIATSIAGAYGTYKKVALMISDLTGKDLPGVNDMTLFGKKESDDKKSGGSDKKGDSTKTSKGGSSSTAEPKAKEEPKTEPPKPTPEPKKEYVPTITPVKEIKLSDLYDRTGIMPSLSTTLMSTSDIAKGRDRTKPYMGVLMDDIMAPSTKIKPASSGSAMDYFLDLDEVIKHASVLLSDIPIVT